MFWSPFLCLKVLIHTYIHMDGHFNIYVFINTDSSAKEKRDKKKKLYLR